VLRKLLTLERRLRVNKAVGKDSTEVTLSVHARFEMLIDEWNRYLLEWDVQDPLAMIGEAIYR
jgi:hypothetical protein